MSPVAPLLLVVFAFADESKTGAMLQPLPPDGSRVTFNAIIKVDGREILPTWTVRTVGQAFHKASNAA